MKSLLMDYGKKIGELQYSKDLIKDEWRKVLDELNVPYVQAFIKYGYEDVYFFFSTDSRLSADMVKIIEKKVPCSFFNEKINDDPYSAWKSCLYIFRNTVTINPVNDSWLKD